MYVYLFNQVDFSVWQKSRLEMWIWLPCWLMAPYSYDRQYLKRWEQQRTEVGVFYCFRWLKGQPLLVETAWRCQKSYRSVMLTSLRAMGNSHGLDRRQREDCALIKRGIVFLFSPRMFILRYLQTSVTCSRQMPVFSRHSYSVFNCSQADCLGHLITGAVNHCRHGLLLLVLRYIIFPQPQEISHGASTAMTWMDFIVSQAFFCALIMATLAWKAQLPDVKIIIILIAWALRLWCDAILLSCGCVHLQSPKF